MTAFAALLLVQLQQWIGCIEGIDSGVEVYIQRGSAVRLLKSSDNGKKILPNDEFWAISGEIEVYVGTTRFPCNPTTASKSHPFVVVEASTPSAQGAVGNVQGHPAYTIQGGSGIPPPSAPSVNLYSQKLYRASKARKGIGKGYHPVTVKIGLHSNPRTSDLAIERAEFVAWRKQYERFTPDPLAYTYYDRVQTKTKIHSLNPREKDLFGFWRKFHSGTKTRPRPRAPMLGMDIDRSETFSRVYTNLEKLAWISKLDPFSLQKRLLVSVGLNAIDQTPILWTNEDTLQNQLTDAIEKQGGFVFSGRRLFISDQGGVYPPLSFRILSNMKEIQLENELDGFNTESVFAKHYYRAEVFARFNLVTNAEAEYDDLLNIAPDSVETWEQKLLFSKQRHLPDVDKIEKQLTKLGITNFSGDSF